MRWSVPAYALVLALLVVGPLLGPGYLLLRDAVSTPRSYLTDAALGLTAAPRATPQDFAVALASHLLDGGVVVKALLVSGLWLAGWGAARLAATVLPDAGAPGQFVATTLAIWNPYVAERLLQGHWSLLVGYGCLPWVATAMLTLRSGAATGWFGFFGLCFWIALAGLTPTGQMLAATVALVCVAAPGAGRSRWLCAATALGAALVTALPWLTASAVGATLTARESATVLGVSAFAPRAEPGLGTLGSLASLGGIWNGEAVPYSRTTLFAVSSALVLLAVVVAGLPTAGRRPSAIPLLVLAAVSVVVPAALATGPGYPPAQRGDRRRSRSRCAARRAEVGGAGGARIHPGGRGCGADAAAVAAAGGDGAGVLSRAVAGIARPGLGRLRQGRRSAATRPAGPRWPPRSTTGREPWSHSGVARRHHAALLLVRSGSGAGSAAPLGARRRVDHRRPHHFGRDHSGRRRPCPSGATVAAGGARSRRVGSGRGGLAGRRIRQRRRHGRGRSHARRTHTGVRGQGVRAVSDRRRHRRCAVGEPASDADRASGVAGDARRGRRRRCWSARGGAARPLRPRR